MDRRDLAEVRLCSAGYHATSLDTPNATDGSLADLLLITECPTRAWDTSHALAHAVARLTERERLILRLRFVEERTQSQIGARIGEPDAGLSPPAIHRRAVAPRPRQRRRDEQRCCMTASCGAGATGCPGLPAGLPPAAHHGPDPLPWCRAAPSSRGWCPFVSTSTGRFWSAGSSTGSRTTVAPWPAPTVWHPSRSPCVGQRVTPSVRGHDAGIRRICASRAPW